jgi:UDP-N-acetylglucosamine/UDP-N-acetylgalactosamine diphosphorylase
MHLPDDLRQQLQEHDQMHVLEGWDALDAEARAHLVGQLRALDFDELKLLYAERDHSFTAPTPARIQPLPNVLPDAVDPESRRIGENALRQGEVAVVLVAGGQGSRLGFEHPKGMYPIGPISKKSLFQLHAEKVLARGRRYGRRIPFLVMTSHATHAETESFFLEHRFFELDPEDVTFFRQGTMPALDLASGRLLLEAPGRLFTSPNGHGGTLTAMSDSGLLDRLHHVGVRHIFYFQVDNPLVKIADPVFLGHHIAAKSEVSSKVIPKNGPLDKLGNLVLIDGKLSIIEYSDLPHDLAEARNPDGSLKIAVGNPAIHIFDLDFLQRMTAHGGTGLPYHVARKKVPFFDAKSGTTIAPKTENALKFERFIFDVLPHSERWIAVATSRQEEFEPLKNATGTDSPESVRRAMIELASDWLEKAGAKRMPGVTVEISPLWALEPNDVKIPRGTTIDSDTYFDK